MVSLPEILSLLTVSAGENCKSIELGHKLVVKENVHVSCEPAANDQLILAENSALASFFKSMRCR